MLWTLLAILVPILSIIKWFWTSCASSAAALARECEVQGIPHIARKGLLRDWDALLSLRTKVLCFSLERNARVFTSDPLLLRGLFVDFADSYCKPSFVRVLEILGDGVFSSCGMNWSRQRQLLNSQFSGKVLKTKVQSITHSAVSAARDLIQTFENDTIEIDIHQLFLKLTLEILNRTTFESRGIGENSSRILESLKRYHHYKRKLACSSLPGYRFLQERVYQDKAYVTSLVKMVLEERRYAENQQYNLLLDFLLEARKTNKLSEKELLDNCTTLLLAGHETTASLLGWTFYLLALHPVWQEQARAEVMQTLSQEDELSMASLGHLKTLANILLEVLRLYPPQPVIGRTCVKEHTLGNYRIPVGLELVVPVAALHRNEEFWGPGAADFNPGRFAKGIQGACSHPLAFLPFGTGPRTCMGQSLALMEAKLVLVVFLRRFRWELSRCYRHCPSVTLTLQPGFGMPVVMKRL